MKRALGFTAALFAAGGAFAQNTAQAVATQVCAACHGADGNSVAWQAHIARVSGSSAYGEPAYPYQRAAYYYSNVTYGENSWLIDPFQPELGRTLPRDLAWRVGRNLLAIPRSIGESAWIAVASAPYLLDKMYRGLHLPWKQPPREPVLSVTNACLTLIGIGALVGAGLLLVQGEWLYPLYFGLSLAMISLTPWPSQFWRYLAPMTPLSYLFFKAQPCANH